MSYCLLKLVEDFLITETGNAMEVLNGNDWVEFDPGSSNLTKTVKFIQLNQNKRKLMSGQLIFVGNLNIFY